MVTSGSNAVDSGQRPPRFIYITGCDGTGKTTQAERLLVRLRRVGIEPRHLWLRFPFFLTLPLLVYARLRGCSWYEEQNGVRQGYWDFRPSWLLRNLFPWVLLLDATLAALVKVYLPLWLGRTIVCERFVLDMLVDLAVALDDPEFHRRLPGRLYVRLLPQEASITILDLDAETIRARRADLEVDKQLDARLRAFRSLASRLSLTVLSSRRPIDEINGRILPNLSDR